MMKKQVLTIDQMKRLKGLGIDTSIASMYWTYRVEPERITRLTPVGEKGNLKSWEERGYGIGAFTLQDILGIMPVFYPTMENGNRILVGNRQVDSGCHYQPTIFHSEDGWFCSYFDSDELLDERPSDSYNNPLDAAYDMLCWLYETDYLPFKN